MNEYLPSLGTALRQARKRTFPRDNLEAFALRVGVSRATLQKMEKGDLSVSLGRYYEAARILGIPKQIESLFILEVSLFDE